MNQESRKKYGLGFLISKSENIYNAINKNKSMNNTHLLNSLFTSYDLKLLSYTGCLSDAKVQ